MSSSLGARLYPHFITTFSAVGKTVQCVFGTDLLLCDGNKAAQGGKEGGGR
jgi:hypothetical protein